jgi:hypothetical protein
MSAFIEGGASIPPEHLSPLIPEGLYQCGFNFYETHHGGGGFSPKVVMQFVILPPNDYAGTMLYKFYNVAEVRNPVGRNGPFIPPFRGDFTRDYFNFFGKPTRLDRMPINKPFQEFTWACLVETVTTNPKGRAIPDDARYSIIRSIAPWTELPF